jgi:hypothetical protein
MKIARMFLYVPNFLNAVDYRHLLDELSEVQLNDEDNRYAPGRLRTFMPPGSKTYQVFTSRQILESFSAFFNQELESAAVATPTRTLTIPIEYRKYPIGCGGMGWHSDVAILGNQYECVYTVTNTSDSQTIRRDWFGHQEAIWAEPNSLIAVRANGVSHGVTPVTQGERTIVKFALCEKNVGR